jgi:hypothetical protein
MMQPRMEWNVNSNSNSKALEWIPLGRKTGRPRDRRMKGIEYALAKREVNGQRTVTGNQRTLVMLRS